MAYYESRIQNQPPFYFFAKKRRTIHQAQKKPKKAKGAGVDKILSKSSEYIDKYRYIRVVMVF